MKKILSLLLTLAAVVMLFTGCGKADSAAQDTVTERDASGDYDASGAVTLASSDDLTITEAGTYILSGKYEDQTIIVEVGKEDKVQLVLQNAELTNADGPAILIRSADKVFLTAADGTENTISDGTGYTLTEGDAEVDAAVFSKEDLTINGAGKLTISGNYKHAVVSKDELVVTAKALTLTAVETALSGKEAVAVEDAVISAATGNDGINTEGTATIRSGSLTFQCGDDGIHADDTAVIEGGTLDITAAEGIEATHVRISGGEITISASDDGVNAAQKSDTGTPSVEISGGTLTITMGAGDTDGIDSNGDVTITGGTISINGSSAFDFDGSATLTGGTVYVNGQQVTTLTTQMMGGPGGMQGGPGGFEGDQGGFGGPGGRMEPPGGH